jgi:hypothetical protein
MQYAAAPGGFPRKPGIHLKGVSWARVDLPHNPAEDPQIIIATFADPDNNYFQLMTPMESK